MGVFIKEYHSPNGAHRQQYIFGKVSQSLSSTATEDMKHAHNEAYWHFSDMEMLLKRFGWEYGYLFISTIPDSLDLAIFSTALAKNQGAFTEDVERTLKETISEDHEFAEEAVKYALDHLAGMMPEENHIHELDSDNSANVTTEIIVDNIYDQMFEEMDRDANIRQHVYKAVLSAAIPSALARFHDLFNNGFPARGAHLEPFYRSINDTIPPPSLLDTQQDIQLIRSGMAYNGNILWEIEFNTGLLGKGTMHSILGMRSMKIYPLFNMSSNIASQKQIEVGMNQVFNEECPKLGPAIRRLADAARQHGKDIIVNHFANKDAKLNNAITAYRLYGEDAWSVFEYTMYDTFDFLNDSEISSILTEVNCSDSIEVIAMRKRAYDGLNTLLIACGMISAWDEFKKTTSQMFPPLKNNHKSTKSAQPVPDPERFRTIQG